MLNRYTLKKIIRVALASMLIMLATCQANRRYFSVQRVQPDAYQSDYNVQLGLDYLLIGNMQRAKLKLIKALYQSPRSANANGAMAYYLDTIGEVERAEVYYKKAIRYAQQKGPFLNNYGVFLCRAQRYQSALHYFEAAMQENEYLNTAAAYENAGLCMEAAAQWGKAHHYFSLALRADPLRPISLLELAKISAERQDYQQANAYLVAYEKLIEPDLNAAQLGYKVAMQLDDNERMAYYLSLLRHYEDQDTARSYDIDLARIFHQ